MKKYQVIILAAGKGTRLRPYTKNTPKTLIKIKNKPLISRILSSINKKFVSEILITVGYKAIKIKKFLGHKHKGIDIKYIYNSKYSATNSTYSMWLAIPHLKNNLIIINADTIFDKKIMKILIDSKYSNGLAVDDKINLPLPEEAMKVTLNNKKIIDVSKKVKKNKTHGDAIGIYKFNKIGKKHLITNLKKLVIKNNTKNLFTLAVKRMLKDINVYSISTQGKKWIEIDDINDYKNAIKLF